MGGGLPSIRGMLRADTHGDMYLSADILALACDLPPGRAARFNEPLDRAMRKHSISTPLRASHFLAQIGHESGRFRYLEEVWGPTEQQRRYDVRSGSELALRLGNELPGEGERFRGRGLIQLTGRANYALYTRESGINALRYPDVLCEPYWASDVAAWYFRRWGCLEAADADDARQVTRKINGGYNGLSDRLKLLQRAKQVLFALNYELAPRGAESL